MTVEYPEEGQSPWGEQLKAYVDASVEIAEAAADAAEEAVALIETAGGSGSPEGVVTADVGARYTDHDATRGAILWVKASGTGNTGWKVAYGDTGWRVNEFLVDDKTRLLPYPPTFNHIRRINNRVHLRTRVRVTADLIGTNRLNSFRMVSIPSGFRTSDYTTKGIVAFWIYSGVLTNAGDLYSLTAGFPSLGSGTWVGDETLDCEVSWLTDDAWPTTLGSAA